MKLELKHLAPYLPYRLMVRHESGLFVEMTLSRKSGNFLSVESVLEGYGVPMLKPLSDLTKEIEFKGEKFVPVEKLFEIFAINKKPHYQEYYVNDYPNYIECSHPSTSESLRLIKYDLMQNRADLVLKLYEWHFDVFGLIEKGLAIKKDTHEN